MSAALEQLRGALADRYAVTRELGQGGMATVYLAEDLKHHRKVAVKVLMIRRESGASSSLVVVLNWIEGVRSRMGRTP